MNTLISSLLAMALFLGSCGKSNDIEKLTVASIQGDCIGMVPMKCLLVKRTAQADWEFFYSNIDGFVYEPGYEYVLEVKIEEIEHPAADQSSLRYILVKEISKEKKESENLPDMSAVDDQIAEPTE